MSIRKHLLSAAAIATLAAACPTGASAGENTPSSESIKRIELGLPHDKFGMALSAQYTIEVQPDNLDRAHLHDSFWEEVDLGANQIGDLERLFPREDLDSDLMVFLHLNIDRRLNLTDEFCAHGLKFKVHAPFERVHVAAGDFGAIITEDRSA